MLPWKPHTSQVASYSQQEDLFNQIWLSFNFSGEIYAATPSTNLTTSLGRRISLGLLLKNLWESSLNFTWGEDLWFLQETSSSWKWAIKSTSRTFWQFSRVWCGVSHWWNVGHPLATLAVANERLDAIGETPLTCSNKSCEANGIEGKS